MEIKHINNSPSCKALWHSPHTFSNAQKNIINDITKKLNFTEKGKFADLPLINWLEKKGYDVFLTSGARKDSVKMQLVDRVKKPKSGYNQLHPAATVGEYTSNNSFNPIDVQKAHKYNVGMLTGFYIVSSVILASIIGGIFISRHNAKLSNFPQKIEHVSKKVSDTLNLLSKDTIAL